MDVVQEFFGVNSAVPRRPCVVVVSGDFGLWRRAADSSVIAAIRHTAQINSSSTQGSTVLEDLNRSPLDRVGIVASSRANLGSREPSRPTPECLFRISSLFWAMTVAPTLRGGCWMRWQWIVSAVVLSTIIARNDECNISATVIPLPPHNQQRQTRRATQPRAARPQQRRCAVVMASTTTTAGTAVSSVLDEYLTLVPRGLQDVVQEALPQQIRQEAAAAEDDKGGSQVITITIEGPTVVGEDPMNYDAAHLRDLRDRLSAAVRKKQRKKRPRTTTPTEEDVTRSFPTGAIHDDTRTNRHVALGYDEHDSWLWCIPGANTGAVWLRFATDAPPHVVATCRCIGPLLALVQVYSISENDGDDDAVKRLGQAMQNVDWQRPLNLWQRHLQPESPSSSFSLDDHYTSQNPLKYRCSCVRDESPTKQHHEIPRQQLLQDAATHLAPPQFSSQDSEDNNRRVKVNLSDFDMELVWFCRPHTAAVAISLRRYPPRTTTFASGQALPPDITPPYIQSGNNSSNDDDDFVVRLRPTTARLLLHLACLRDGDVLVDPCVGIGTIVLECLHLRRRQHHAITALGGDLALSSSSSSLRATAVAYEAATRRFLRDDTNTTTTGATATLCAWDAATLPLRTASVDVIVSDLPFGQSCLSSSRLHQLVPLLLECWARVLRPSTGRVVLLCGNPDPLLQGMHQANERFVSSQPRQRDSIPQDSSSSSTTTRTALVWELPVDACRPVNVGGHQVWILRVRRGAGAQHDVDAGRRTTPGLAAYVARRDRRRSLPQR